MPSLLDVHPDLQPVHDLMRRSLARVEQRFNDQVRCDLPPVQRLCQHVERYRGKMLRPTLVVLCALAARPAPELRTPTSDVPPLSDDHITLAAVCEMIHMATLIHDDVLDEADTRRSGATLNRLHGNEPAVILGDYLFSAAYRLCSTLHGSLGRAAAILIGATGMTLCAGELLQLHHRENFSIDEPTYFEIVQRKTASLIAVACRLGAAHAGADEPTAARFHDFGLNLGVAFQIQDDLLDLLGSASTVGKSVGKDVQLGKLTLPVIHHLAAAAPTERGRTLLLLRGFRESDPGSGVSGSERDPRTPIPEPLIDALERTGSIDHARSVAQSLVDQAKRGLDPIPDTPAKRFLFNMADAVVTREF